MFPVGLQALWKEHRLELKENPPGPREQTCVARREGGGSGRDRELRAGRCTPLHLEWISNEVLLHSPGHSIQSPGMEHDGRQHEKKNVYL